MLFPASAFTHAALCLKALPFLTCQENSYAKTSSLWLHPRPILAIFWRTRKSLSLMRYMSISCRPVTAHPLRCVCWRNLSFLLDYRHEGRPCVSVIFLFRGANKCLRNWLWGSESIKSIKYNVEKKRELTFINHFLGARQYALFHLNFTVTLRGRYFFHIIEKKC